MNRVDRLMAIVVYLQARRVARAEDLARHFEISVRTVYRDIAALGEAGVPVIAEAGVGYALMKGYFLPPVSLTAEEASALVAAAILLRHHSDASLDKHTSSAIMKVRSVLPRDRQNAFDDLERTMAPLDCSARKYAVDLADLQSALCRRSVLRISYEAPGPGRSDGA
jgi:predicted DNA-binding transcriptional regulator YafY